MTVADPASEVVTGKSRGFQPGLPDGISGGKIQASETGPPDGLIRSTSTRLAWSRITGSRERLPNREWRSCSADTKPSLSTTTLQRPASGATNSKDPSDLDRRAQATLDSGRDHSLCRFSTAINEIVLDQHAERLFRRARQGFLELGAPFELALVGLDLSELLKREGRWSELEDLAAETFESDCLLSADTESIAALSLWMDAVRAKKLDDGVVADVRLKLEQRMWRHGSARGRRR